MENILVAKSYQDLPKVGEVFISSGRQYINVQLKSGKLKTVRVYSDAEFRKLYPKEKVEIKNKYYRPRKEVLGFDKGYITVLINADIDKHAEWLVVAKARYHKQWGWYIISTEAIPENRPEEITIKKLLWEEISEKV